MKKNLFFSRQDDEAFFCSSFSFFSSASEKIGGTNRRGRGLRAAKNYDGTETCEYGTNYVYDAFDQSRANVAALFYENLLVMKMLCAFVATMLLRCKRDKECGEKQLQMMKD